MPGKIGLWIATAFVVLFAAAPPILGAIAERTASKAWIAKRAAFTRGKELAKVGGFHDLALDVPNQTLTKDLGYEAEITSQTTARLP